MVQEYDNKDIGDAIDKAFNAGFNAAIEKACDWFKMTVSIPQEVSFNEDGEPLAESYIEYAKKRLEAANEIIKEFKEYMKS